MRQTTTNAADPRQVSRAAKAERRAALERRVDLRGIIRTRSGRRYLWALLCECGLFESSFSPDLALMAHKEGERNVGLRIFADLNSVDETIYHQMAIEAQQEAEADAVDANPKKKESPDHDDSSDQSSE